MLNSNKHTIEYVLGLGCCVIYFAIDASFRFTAQLRFDSRHVLLLTAAIPVAMLIYKLLIISPIAKDNKRRTALAGIGFILLLYPTYAVLHSLTQGQQLIVADWLLATLTFPVSAFLLSFYHGTIIALLVVIIVLLF
jgi:hypothetical protein